MFIRFFILVTMMSLFTQLVKAENFYCDPVNGSMVNNGTEASPWGSMKSVFDAKKKFNPGDTLFLHSGNHGDVLLFGRNEDYVVVQAVAGEKPLLSSLNMMSASFWKFNGLHISSQLKDGNNVYSSPYIVTSNEKTDHLFFDRCEVYSTLEDISTWDREKWFTTAVSGFLLKGTHSTLHHCYIKNINFGIAIEGRYSEVINCTIENFVGDGIRALSSFSKYEYNTVKNSFDITGYAPNYDGRYPEFPIGGGNHDDCFQSYTASVGGVEEVVEEVVVRWNKFISYTDPNQIDKSICQGIGCFDGYFFNWNISNNLIVTDMWNGITFMGIENSVIANNTVMNNPIYNGTKIDGNLANNYTPWIWVAEIKESAGGGPSNNNIVRNNLIIQSNAGNGKELIDEGENTLIENNLVVPKSKMEEYFIDYKNLDFRLKPGSPAINAGVNIDLPGNDLDKEKRLYGSAVDCGAYEFNEETSTLNCPEITPVDNIEIKETHQAEILFTASDPENDPVKFTIDDLPAFMEISDNSDGTASLSIEPNEGQAGIYTITVSVTDGIFTNSRSFTVTVLALPVGVADLETSNTFRVFPNPIKMGQQLTLNFGNKQVGRIHKVQIFNMNGQLVYFKQLSGDGEELFIDSSVVIQPGSYCVKVEETSKMLVVI